MVSPAKRSKRVAAMPKSKKGEQIVVEKKKKNINADTKKDKTPKTMNKEKVTAKQTKIEKVVEKKAKKEKVVGKKGKIGDEVLSLVESKKPSAVDTAVKHVQKLKARKEDAKVAKASELKRGIILLNHIPHGFYEEEMRKYFSQFGRVLRLKLARSKTTGKSKGFAFIEFEFEEVAKIVAEAMNGYLMYERLMKCEVLPSTVNSQNLFSFSYVRQDNFPKLRARRRVKDEQTKSKSEEEVKEFLEFRLKKLDEQNKKWAALGIKYKYTPPTISTS